MFGRRFYNLIFSSVIFIAVLFLGSCAEKFELSITGLSGGSVSMSPNDGAYSEGTRVTLTATPDSGYAFTGWGNIAGYSADSATGKSIEIIMPGDSLEISAGFSVPGKGWLFMLYMAGDNSLSTQVNIDINEIEKGLYDAFYSGNTAIAGDVRVLILADKNGPGDTRLYLAAPDKNTYTVASTVIIDGAYGITTELNMAEPDNLQHFVEYGLAKYPSEHNALVLWNHGGGVKSLETDPLLNKAICEDEGDIMYLNEVQTAVEAALGGSKLDIIGMDSCIMGEVETAYEMRTVADYFVASAANELGYGWGYNYIFNKFTTAGNTPAPAEMTDILVTQFKESAPSVNHYDPDTMVAVKTSELDELKKQIDTLAAKIYTDYDNGGSPSAAVKTAFEACRDTSVYYFDYIYTYDLSRRNIPYHDLYSFCDEVQKTDSGFNEDVKTQAGAVKNALASSIVACYGDSSRFDAYHTSWPPLDLNYNATVDEQAVRGLSIMIPHGELSYSGKSYYYDIRWYGYVDYNTTVPGIVLGGIDFCTYNSNGTVETWRELFEAWYDDYPDIDNSSGIGMGYTPGNY